MKLQEIIKKQEELNQMIENLKNEPTLEVGKVYKHGNLLACFQGYEVGYGFNTKTGNFYTEICMINPKCWQPATDQEWLEALTKEAKKRGYKNGNYKCLYSPKQTDMVDVDSFKFYNGKLFQGKFNKGHNQIMDAHGNWAEIIEEKVYLPTKESELTSGEDVHCIAYSGLIQGDHFKDSTFIANTFHTKQRAEQMKAFQKLIRFNDEWVLRLGIEQYELFDFEADIFVRFQEAFKDLFIKAGNLIQR
jgi:hypothetical protein